MRLLTITLLLVGICLVTGGCAPSGADLARQDISQGRLLIHMQGKPANWFPEYAELVRARLGVGFALEGCVVTEQSEHQFDEYDGVMTAEIERRFGKGVLTRLFDEAERNYRNRETAASRPAA